MPSWVENLLLGQVSTRQRSFWMFLLVLLLVLVPIADSLGRDTFHFNLYPLPVVLSILLFGHPGLFSVLVVLILYHLVQVSLELEAHAVMVNNLAQLGLTYVVGILCSWLVEAYRALYEQKAELAATRHEILLNLTHELRNPLFAIRGTIRNLSRNFSKMDQDQVARQLNDAQAAIATINRDVEGLTQVFRTDLSGLETHPVEVSVDRLFEDVLKRHPPAFHPDHDLVATHQRPEQTLYCDPLLTMQILDNLLSNALRHTEEGTVTLSSEVVGEEMKLNVRDQGPGIAAQDRLRIFQRHDRGSGSRQQASGFGVGLYLVQMYVEAQGGRIVVDNPPSGASFSVFLPLKESYD